MPLFHSFEWQFQDLGDVIESELIPISASPKKKKRKSKMLFGFVLSGSVSVCLYQPFIFSNLNTSARYNL